MLFKTKVCLAIVIMSKVKNKDKDLAKYLSLILQINDS
jgi:hypothetical protein